MAFHFSTSGCGPTVSQLFALLIFTSLERACLQQSAEAPIAGSPIPLAQLYAHLSRASPEFRFHHLALMYTVTGYGHRLYDTSEDVSAGCRITTNATIGMEEQLNIFADVRRAIQRAVNETVPDLRTAAEQRLHPVEYVCRRVEKLLAEEDAVLRAAFDRAKKVANYSVAAAAAAAAAAGRPRPPLASKIFESLPAMHATVNEGLVIPEFARTMAGAGFWFQAELGRQNSSSWNRISLLPKSVVSVAKSKSQFADQIQSVYIRTLDETVPRITEDAKSGVKHTFWFLPDMMRKLYGYIAENSALKREIEKAAAIEGRDYDEADLDFSKI